MYLPYKKHPNFVLGFHGCDREVGEAVLAGRKQLRPSDNQHDWLGKGIYFWEASPARAMQFAKEAMSRPFITGGHIKNPFVVGAIIDLGVCCNLHDQDSVDELDFAYQELKASHASANVPMPRNEGGDDRLQRHLDCAVVNYLHVYRQKLNLPAYNSVRASFHEGGELYTGSGFTRKSHVQIAVRDTQQILGYFRPFQTAPQPNARSRIRGMMRTRKAAATGSSK